MGEVAVDGAFKPTVVRFRLRSSILKITPMFLIELRFVCQDDKLLVRFGNFSLELSSIDDSGVLQVAVGANLAIYAYV